MRTILLIFFMAVTAIAAFGQDKMDVIYLKNGQVIKGSIIKPLDADGVKIMTTESDVYSFSADEVRRIAREEIEHDNLKNKVFVHDGEGFTNITTLSYGFGIGSVGDERPENNDNNYFGIHTINGFHINRYVSLGAGLGIEGYGDFELVPLYADLRVYPSLTEWAPFFYGNLGYGLGFLESNIDGGMMIGLGGGIQRSVKSDLAFVGSLGYRFQENNIGTQNMDAHYLQLSIGVKF